MNKKCIMVAVSEQTKTAISLFVKMAWFVTNVFWFILGNLAVFFGPNHVPRPLFVFFIGVGCVHVLKYFRSLDQANS